MIKTDNLCVNFKKIRALDSISLEIGRKESILLAGANGSGKTTLLRSIAGVLLNRPESIQINGQPVSHKTRRITAYISACVSAYDSLTVEEARRLHLSFYPDFRNLEIPGFTINSRRRVGTLSRGEKTLFLLNLALGTEPEYLLIDDVLHYLDPHLRDSFLNTILETIETREMSVIIAAHSSLEIEGIVERAVVLNRGQVAIDKTVEELKRKFVRCYSSHPLSDRDRLVFSRKWSGTWENYIYPFDGQIPKNTRLERLTLSEIIRALIGGKYAEN